MTAAVVPVKRLQAGKSRLAGSLGRPGAERLALAMLDDVLAALAGVDRLDVVAVVTDDAEVAAHAERAGARALHGADDGLNAALDRAARELGPACDGGLLVVLGDVAGARSDELDALLEALAAVGKPGVALAASGDGGSSALARNPHDVIPNCFGAGSASAHREAARRAGVPVAELSLPSLAVDVDAAADFDTLLGGAGPGRNTRRVLGELGLAPRT